MCCYALRHCQRIFCNAPDLDLQCWWKTKKININILIAKGGDWAPSAPPCLRLWLYIRTTIRMLLPMMSRRWGLLIFIALKPHENKTAATQRTNTNKIKWHAWRLGSQFRSGLSTTRLSVYIASVFQFCKAAMHIGSQSFTSQIIRQAQFLHVTKLSL